MVIISDIWAFLIATVIPVLLVAYLLRKFGKFKEIDSKFIYLFTFLIFCISILANVFWAKFVFNHIYYEWDYLFIFYYSPIVRDYPVMEGLKFFDISNGTTMAGSWLANGWSQFYLFALWLLITSVIYIISSLLALIFFRKLSNKSYKKFTIKLMGLLTLISFLSGISNLGSILVGLIAYPQMILLYIFSFLFNAKL